MMRRIYFIIIRGFSTIDLEFCSKGYKSSDGVMRLYKIDEESGVRIELERVEEVSVDNNTILYNSYALDFESYSVFFKEYYIELKLYMMLLLYNEDYGNCFLEEWDGKHDSDEHTIYREGFPDSFLEFGDSFIIRRAYTVSIVKYDPYFNVPFTFSNYFINKHLSLNNSFVLEYLGAYNISLSKYIDLEFTDFLHILDFLSKHTVPIRHIKSVFRHFIRIKKHNLYIYTPSKLYINNKNYSINIIKSFYIYIIKFITGLSVHYYNLFYDRLFYKEEFGLSAISNNIYHGYFDSIMCFNTFNVRGRFFGMRSRYIREKLMKPEEIKEEYLSGEEVKSLPWIKSNYMWSQNRTGFNTLEEDSGDSELDD